MEVDAMGMTDNQWYGDLRNQLDNWNFAKKKLESKGDDGQKIADALEIINMNIRRIKENLEK